MNAFQVTRATNPTPQAQPPQAKLTARLVGDGFELPGGVPIREGPRVREVENAGAEGHEPPVFWLAPGKTMEDVTARLARPEKPMSVLPAGGAQTVTRGRASPAHLNLAPGESLLLGAVPRPERNAARGRRPAGRWGAGLVVRAPRPRVV